MVLIGQAKVMCLLGEGMLALSEPEPNALIWEEMSFYSFQLLVVQPRGNSQILRKSILHILQLHKS